MADLWSLGSPLGGGKVIYTQESPKDLMTDYWRRGSPPYGDRSSSSEEATCIDVTGPDDKDDLPPDLLSGGCGVDSLETAISTQVGNDRGTFPFKGFLSLFTSLAFSSLANEAQVELPVCLLLATLPWGGAAGDEAAQEARPERARP